MPTRSARVGAEPQRDQALVDVPPSIGPVVFGTLGVGWVMVRCPRQYDELMRRAGGCLGAGRAAMAGRATSDRAGDPRAGAHRRSAVPAGGDPASLTTPLTIP